MMPKPETTPPEVSGSDRKIGVGELGVLQETGVLRTLLGSCIGLVLHDPRTKVGGLAHIVLPHSEIVSELPGKYANTAIPELIRRIELAGGSTERLIAKVAGGANMFAWKKAPSIGEQNAVVVLQLLKKAGIPVLGQDCGGGHGRRMAYYVETGVVRVEVVGQETILL